MADGERQSVSRGKDRPKCAAPTPIEDEGKSRARGFWAARPGESDLYLSEALADALDCSSDAPLTVAALLERVPESERQAVREHLEAALQGDSGELRHRLELDGRRAEVRHRVAVAGDRIVGTLDTEIESPDLERARLAGQTDPLTGLPNRRQFNEAVQAAVARARRSGRRIAVLHVDVDGFRDVVDSFGADLADRVLTSVAGRLRSLLRTSDTLARGPGRAVTRIGGAGFLVALPDLGGRFEPPAAANRLLQRLREPYEIGSGSISVSVSVGVAEMPDAGLEAGELIRHAEVALAHARKQGGDRMVVFREGLEEEAATRLQQATELHRDVRAGRMELVYQPVFQPVGRGCQGVEALVRWRHPDKGLLEPEEFLDVAEDTGIIVQLGDWVLHEACAQWRRWLDAGIGPVEVAVNLSGRQLRDPALVNRVGKALNSAGMDPIFLRLEIPEEILSPGNAGAREALRRVRGLGVGLTIDDFGTGSSSLAMLRQIDVDLIKVGRSFVSSIPDDQEHTSLVAAIVSMAHKLRFRVVAEGVETEQQLRHLADLDCEGVQGFLLGEPAPAPQLDELLARSLGTGGEGVVVPFRRRAAS